MPDCFAMIFSPGTTEHKHSGIGLLTPEHVHYGMDKEVVQRRATVLEAAFGKQPKRFVPQAPV
jgi:putative transposase